MKGSGRDLICYTAICLERLRKATENLSIAGHQSEIRNWYLTNADGSVTAWSQLLEMYVCMYVCMYVYMHVCTVRMMYVCMRRPTYICLGVCVCVCVCG